MSVLLLLLAGAAPRWAHAEPREEGAPRSPEAPAPPAPPGLGVGGLAGWESGRASGPALRVELELPARPLSSRLALSWVASAGYARLTRREARFGADRVVTLNVVAAVPAARLAVLASARANAWVEAGLGLAHTDERVVDTFAFSLGKTSTADGDLGLVARVGAGGWLHATPRLDLGLAASAGRTTGALGQTSAALLLGVMFRP